MFIFIIFNFYIFINYYLDKSKINTLQGHLIIGPPSSGKSTIARTMAPVFQAEIISSDIIRKDIYGNEEEQGDWSEIFNLIKKKIIECINNEKNFIVDATNARRSWRLNFTQNFYPLTEIDWVVGNNSKRNMYRME